MAPPSKPNMDLTLGSVSLVASDYIVYNVIGRGCMGQATVNIAKHTPSSKFLAVRRLTLDQCQYEIEEIQHESLMTGQLRCANILPILATFCDRQTLWTVMPYMAYGSCTDILHAGYPHGMQEQIIAIIIQSVLHALAYLHEKNVIHRSIRASHILVSDTGQVYVSGLRTALSTTTEASLHTHVCNYPKHYVNNLNVASPELLAQDIQGYNSKSDIYSVGVLCCHLANGVEPYSNKPATQMLYFKCRGIGRPQLLDRATMTSQEDLDISLAGSDDAAIYESRQFSAGFHQVVHQCLEMNPSHRPSAAQLLQHAFFKSCKCGVGRLCELLDNVRPYNDASAFTKEDAGTVDTIADELQDVSVGDYWL